jgi:DNA-binding MarR family transcriptional regulator
MNSLALDRQLCFALYSASRAMTASYKDLLAELGITYPQYLVMLVLWEEGTSPGDPEHRSAVPEDAEREASEPEDVTVKHLGERLQLDSGTLSPLLSRLEKLGFITRHRSAEDSRSVFVRPTAAGAAAKERAECVPARIKARTELDPDSLAELLGTLHTLAGNLRGDHPPAGSPAADSPTGAPETAPTP